MMDDIDRLVSKFSVFIELIADHKISDYDRARMGKDIADDLRSLLGPTNANLT